MRLKQNLIPVAIMLAAIAAVSLALVQHAVFASPAAQNPDTIPAEQSTAMAKTLVQQMIAALGGDAYLHMRDSDCTGRLTQFGQLTGELGGFADFHSYWIFPDKYRREVTSRQPMPIPIIGSIGDISKTGHLIDVFNGDQGWTLEKGGVSDEDAATIAAFQAGLKISFETLVRRRLSESDLEYRYRGEDVVDLKQSDWVEITDTDQHAFRIAVDRGTHLPVRYVVISMDPNTGEQSQETTIYSNWHVIDGIETPFDISREHDNRRVTQNFYYGCKYNTGLSPELFTKASLKGHPKIKSK